MIFMWVHLGPNSTEEEKKCVRVLRIPLGIGQDMRVLFSNVLVAGRDGGAATTQFLFYSYRKTNFSNGIPQRIFIIIIIFIVPCLTIIHGYKQSFSICFSSCVGVGVCVIQCIYYFFVTDKLAPPGFWFCLPFTTMFA